MKSIELAKAVPGTAKQIFPYLATARGLGSWHADEVEGDLAGRSFTLKWPTLHAELRLEVLDVRPEERIVLRAGDSIVTLAAEDGLVRLRHEGLDDTDDLAGFRSSWSLALALLGHAIARHPGERRRVAWAFETLTLSHELAHFYFSNRIGLARWLGTSERDLGPEGSAVALELENGVPLHGEVLAHEPGRDLLLSWRELGDATLVLRTLPAAGGQRTLTLSLGTWGGRACDAELEMMNRALRRLREATKSVGLA